MSLHIDVYWQPNISPRSLTRINRWSRFASNGWGVSLGGIRENPSHFGGCVCERDKQEQAKNVAAAVRRWENTLEHHNQVRRGKEEEDVNMSRFLSSDRSVFKLVFGGSNVFGLALNLVSSFLTLSTLIRLHGLRFGSVEVQIWEQFCQVGLLQFQHRAVLGDELFG
jgi:hypothetical protein